MIARHPVPGSAVYRVVYGEAASWGLAEQLLATVVDNTSWLVWAKTKDAARNRNRPEPVPRPGIAPRAQSVRIGGPGVSLDEMAEYLGWQKPNMGGGMTNGG